MTWVKIDDGFLEHSKIQALSDRALRLHLAGLCSCARRLSDGKLSTLDVMVCRVVAGKATPKHIDELVQAGLWKHARGGYEINDYLDYNPPAERVKAERERWAEVKRKQRAA